MTRGLTPPRPDSELSKLKTRVFNLERILRGLRKARPGMTEVPALWAFVSQTPTIESGPRTWLTLDAMERTSSFDVKGRLVDGTVLILESALYLVTFSVKFEASTSGARGAEVVRIRPGIAPVVVTGEGPVDAEASGSDETIVSGSTITFLGIGDRLELDVWQTSGGDLDVVDEPYATLGVAWLGPTRQVASSGPEE